MTLFSKVRPQTLLKKYQLRPKKYLGQNFLIDQKVIKQIVEAADIQKQDTILEIGPGLGALTEKLAATGAKILAIEKDRKLVKILKERFSKTNNVRIIQGDIRRCARRNEAAPRSYRQDTPPDRGLGQAWRVPAVEAQQCLVSTRNDKIISNLPYYLTAPVIRQFLEMSQPPQLMVLLVQKEVAQRICAQPPRMNLLAVSIQFYSQPKIVNYVSKKSFWPQPEVDGAIISIKPTPSDSPLLRGRTEENPSLNKACPGLDPGGRHREVFFKIIKAGFSHPRKKLINNLSKKLNISKQNLEKIFQQLKIDEKARAENLNLKQWKHLPKQLVKIP